MTRRQLFAASMAETAAATVAGALGAVAIAIAASPLTPIGPARLAEPDPGVSVNVGILAAGAAAIVVLLAARVAVTAWRQAGARPAADVAAPSRRRPLLAERLSRAGVPLAAATGVRFALDPGTGRASVPVRSAMLGLAVAVAAVAGAGTFGANLLRLVGTPSLYGQDWNIALEGQFGAVTPKQFTQITGHVPGITDITYGLHGTVTIGKTVIPAIGLAQGTGPMTSSTVITGRPPATAGQIALGGSVLRQLGLRVGQTVTVSTPMGTRPMLITGSAVFPYFGQGSFTPTDAGEGAETTAAVLAPLANAGGGVAGGYNFALVSFAPGPARAGEHRGVPARVEFVLRGHPAGHVPGHRPAPEHGDQLRRHRRHARGPGRRPRGPRPGGARPVHPRLGPPQAPRLRAAEGARDVPPRPQRGRVLAGRHRDGGRARRRRAARHRRRPVGLAAVREPGGPATRARSRRCRCCG